MEWEGRAIITKILIGYGTTEGQTARIASHLAKAIRSHGIEAEARELKQSKDAGLDRYDAVIVGGSIHMGQHEDYVVDFVRRTSRSLSRRRAGNQLRSVSLAAPCSTASTAFSSAS